VGGLEPGSLIEVYAYAYMPTLLGLLGLGQQRTTGAVLSQRNRALPL